MTKEEAIDNLQDLWNEVYNEDSDGYTYAVAIDMAIKALSADRPHGEWIMHIDDLFPCESTQECSVCHAEQPISISDDNYCPNCGVRMKAR